MLGSNMKLTENDLRRLGRWAAECAERALQAHGVGRGQARGFDGGRDSNAQSTH